MSADSFLFRFDAYTVKTKHPFQGVLYFYTCFGCETKTGVDRILVISQDGPMFSHIIEKVSARAFH